MDATCHDPSEDSAALVRRLNRLSGQVQGIARMVEADRYCIDILTQIAAARAALAQVEDEVLRRHAATCVAAALNDPAAAKEKIDEIVALFGRR